MTWHHAPEHRFTEPGKYIITAGTYKKEHYFASAEKLDRLQETILSELRNAGAAVEAWAIFSNHYHLILDAEEPEQLPAALAEVHKATSVWVNSEDNTRGRRVWYQYWDTHLTYQRSYMARIKYVIENPVRHGLVLNATDYPWCSAAHFEREAPPSLYRSVMNLKTDKVKVSDPWEPVWSAARSAALFRQTR